MYVSQLDRPWIETPFLFQGFEIRSEEDIQTLARYCRHVYVDTPEILPFAPRKREPLPRQPTTTGVEYETPPSRHAGYEVLKTVQGRGPVPAYTDKTTLEEELSAVREHHQQARALVYTLMEDARHGKSLNTLAAKQAVGKVVESVIRNPDALTCFIQLKRKDEYTAQHSLRVCILAVAFGRHLGLDPEELQTLGVGALLHDIGKMKVPNAILNKPGRLDKHEYAIMRTHVPKGVEILEKTRNVPTAALEVVRCHHERYNGNGYAAGLRGEQIGLFGAIGGIVDCYDAITSDRAYHTGMSAHAALKKMYEWRTRDFHPHLVEQFIPCMGIYPIGSIVELITGEVGVVVTLNRLRRLKPRVKLVLRPNYTPYEVTETVDLMHHKTREGRLCEIIKVLEPGTHGINPVQYLPVAAA